MANTIAVSTYKRLVSEIVCLYEGARKVLIDAYWKTGQRIVEVEQAGAAKAAYGANLLQDLSRDLSQRCGPGFSVDNLQKMRRFYLTYPKYAAPRKLTWTQYVELLPLTDPKKRALLETRAIQEGLKSRDIRKLVQAEAGSGEPFQPRRLKSVRESVALLPVPKIGRFDTYQLKDPHETAWPDKNVLLFDHGFKSYRGLKPREHPGLKTGDIVTWTGGKLLKKKGLTAKDLYTYKAYLEKVIDADTYWVALDIGLDEIGRQKLRLQGIDCPEIKTPEGKAAKKFVESVLRGVPYLTVLSHKNDKYDRYEADVFFKDAQGKEIYLNNLLLEAGHAVRMKE